jgi:hypothetical protein
LSDGVIEEAISHPALSGFLSSFDAYAPGDIGYGRPPMVAALLHGWFGLLVIALDVLVGGGLLAVLAATIATGVIRLLIHAPTALVRRLRR